MRVLKDFTLQDCKVTLFQWNNRYIIKLESGPFEQTFKVNEFDFAGDADIMRLLDQAFVGEAVERFSNMARSLHEVRQRVQNDDA